MEPVPKPEDGQPPRHHDSLQPGASQTASDFIDAQLALEADAREILPYKFDKCTNVLGPLRQTVFACLTCSPPPASAAQVYTPAGVCYGCSISCHGEHHLVELFSRRNFTCDCGTSRFPSTSSCTLRSDPSTGSRGVHSQAPAPGNHYNHNYRNHFCACGEEYDAETEKGTMFQCLGLGTVETGGCGEDWYHPECLMGLGREWYKSSEAKQEGSESQRDEDQGEVFVHPVPPGFPNEEEFDAMICYKCVESSPWIKQCAGTPGFLKPVFRKTPTSASSEPVTSTNGPSPSPAAPTSLKRKASDSDLDVRPGSPSKRVKDEEAVPPSALESETTAGPIGPVDDVAAESKPTHTHKHELLPSPAPSGTFSLFLTADFREHLCHCPRCYPRLIPHPQLLEEEDTYEPSLSSGAASASDAGGEHPRGAASNRSHGSRASLLDRGEAALSNVDRVRAIEGVMAYNHLRDKVKEFLKPFAESGTAVSADDIKAYFEKLRGDQGGIMAASGKPVDGGRDGSGTGGPGDGGGGDGGDNATSGNRREQSGY